MNKFYGKIGFIKTEETTPGVWKGVVTERNYYGDILKNYSKRASGESQNDNLDVSIQISIISDPYALDNFQSLRYIEFMGALWKINTAEPSFPRIILSIGGVYNGEE